ncbi:MAG: hypothetical protein JWO59_3004 [Chloroflexi bacterium]|nr:hypothetical protein [Chloroflexota bacterium]
MPCRSGRVDAGMLGRSRPPSCPPFVLACWCRRGDGWLEESGPLLHAVALAGDADHVRVVQEAIEDGAGEHVVADHRAPIAEALVAGQHAGPALVARVDQLEEQLRLSGGEVGIADLVQDQELRSRVGAQAGGEVTAMLGRIQVIEQAGHGGVADGVPGVECVPGQGGGEMGLADPGWPRKTTEVRVAMNERPASSRMCRAESVGRKSKSNSSSVTLGGMCAARARTPTSRWCRWAASAWGDEPVLLLTHFPLLSLRTETVAAGWQCAGDLGNLEAVARPVLQRSARTIVVHGHLHKRGETVAGSVLQITCAALIEPPHEVALLTVKFEGEQLTVCRESIPIGPTPEVRLPVLSPPDKRWAFGAGSWISAPVTGSGLLREGTGCTGATEDL